MNISVDVVNKLVEEALATKATLGEQAKSLYSAREDSEIVGNMHNKLPNDYTDIKKRMTKLEH